MKPATLRLAAKPPMTRGWLKEKMGATLEKTCNERCVDKRGKSYFYTYFSIDYFIILQYGVAVSWHSPRSRRVKERIDHGLGTTQRLRANCRLTGHQVYNMIKPRNNTNITQEPETKVLL